MKSMMGSDNVYRHKEYQIHYKEEDRQAEVAGKQDLIYCIRECPVIGTSAFYHICCQTANVSIATIRDGI